jgi:starch-binding outer membrane protein, SusD/RagB family
MKKYTIKSFVYTIALSLWIITGCTKLDVPVVSEITPDNFPKTEEDFISIEGPLFSNLSQYYMQGIWFNQENTADGMVLTANGGNWYDAGRYYNDHHHTWATDSRFISEAWTCCFGGISKANSLLPLFEKAEESSFKKTAIAEIRAMRAYYYFLAIDMWGDVPLTTTFGKDAVVGGRVARATVSDFIETELLAAIPDLSGVTGSTTYGRPTKWMAYALLAKLYINSPVYTGISRNDDVVSMCDKIITEANTNGKIALDADYLAEFYPTNGPATTDFLFEAVYDANNILLNYPARYWLHKLLKTKYGLPFTPSGCLKTWPAFYDKFTIDNTDVRQKIWLTGIQYNTDGTPITVQTTKKGLDSRYTGTDGSAIVTYTLEFTRNIEFRSLEKFDTGDDYVGLGQGYRCNKFYPDKNSSTRDQSNDIPILRYADVLLMKAEAILRGAAPTMGQTALSLVNTVRARSKASQFTSIDLNGLLDERARELCFEGWRRNDLIRFGKWEDSWGVKTDNDIRHRVLPIPATEIDLNPLMVQNDGY